MLADSAPASIGTESADRCHGGAPLLRRWRRVVPPLRESGAYPLQTLRSLRHDKETARLPPIVSLKRNAAARIELAGMSRSSVAPDGGEEASSCLRISIIGNARIAPAAPCA